MNINEYYKPETSYYYLNEDKPYPGYKPLTYDELINKLRGHTGKKVPMVHCAVKMNYFEPDDNFRNYRRGTRLYGVAKFIKHLSND